MCRSAERHDNITPATVMPRGKLREPHGGNKKQGVLFQLHAPFALHWSPCRSRGAGKANEKANAQPGQFISCGELGRIDDTHPGTSRVLARFGLGAPGSDEIAYIGRLVSGSYWLPDNPGCIGIPTRICRARGLPSRIAGLNFQRPKARRAASSMSGKML